MKERKTERKREKLGYVICKCLIYLYVQKYLKREKSKTIRIIKKEEKYERMREYARS